MNVNIIRTTNLDRSFTSRRLGGEETRQRCDGPQEARDSTDIESSERQVVVPCFTEARDRVCKQVLMQHTAGCIFGGRPTPTDARALSTREIQEIQKIQSLPRYSCGGFETAHVDTSERVGCTYVFRFVVSSHMAELRKPGHPPMLGAFDRVLGHSCPLSIPQKDLNTF